MALRIFFVLFAASTFTAVAAQSVEDIPYENDNQFPPDNHAESNEGIIEGSGAGVIEEPVDNVTEAAAPPPIEEMETKIVTNSEIITPTEKENPCPKPCVCNTEGDSSNFVVNCAGYGLTEFPTPLDIKTTTLNLENNKLTEIPKEISALKNLKILNANNNSLMELMSGSVSELPELTTLKLANNRLIEYPKDLKNSFGLTKLEELDLGGNDMRTSLTSETFSNFKSLRQLTLPITTTDLLEDLCSKFSETLDTVCTGSCSSQSFECADAPGTLEDGFMSALPGLISLSSAILSGDDSNDNVPQITEDNEVKSAPTENSSAVSTSDFSLRSEVNKSPEGISKTSAIIEPPKEDISHHDPDVKVGAKTAETKSQGVDKSVIGIIVAGMVVIVAGITITKNWSSIRKRFGSSPRPANERGGENTNGNVPEAVPLQEKSPV